MQQRGHDIVPAIKLSSQYTAGIVVPTQWLEYKHAYTHDLGIYALSVHVYIVLMSPIILFLLLIIAMI